MQQITLLLFILLGNGQMMDASKEYATVAECSKAGTEFISQDPKELDAIALGFSCFTRNKGEPA